MACIVRERGLALPPMTVDEDTREVPLWVVESGFDRGAGPAYALASRFESPFRKLRDPSAPETGWGAPRLIVTSGTRAGLTGIALRRRFGVPHVHCGHWRMAALMGGHPFDALVLSRLQESGTLPARRVLPVLGPLTLVSTGLFDRARHLWSERLEHLPSPRIAVVLDSAHALPPGQAFEMARRLALSVLDHRGSVLLAVRQNVVQDVADAFVAGLDACFKLVWRHGEPDEDPVLGFVACADALLIHCGRVGTLAELSAADLPVFLGEDPGRFGPENRLAQALLAKDHVRIFDDSFSPWARDPLDEAGRVAGILREKFGM